MKMLPSCRCVSAEGLGNCDKWHFDLSATRTLGERYYEAWRELTGACAQGDVVRENWMEPNYDESKIAPYELEDPLTFVDGRKLKDVSEWPARRVEILKIFAVGFGQGIQAGGEHVICNGCLCAFGLYGWTFGNYEYSCAFNHPITLINCADEQNVNLPLFASCGDNGGKLLGLQEVTMISFNCERVVGHTPGGRIGDDMRETRPGTWRGQIGFTRQPAWNAVNSVDLPLWAEDGSGRGFRTINNAHKPACGTAERRSYYPQYMQQVYDTDLNKLLICTDPARREWRDATGKVVD